MTERTSTMRQSPIVRVLDPALRMSRIDASMAGAGFQRSGARSLDNGMSLDPVVWTKGAARVTLVTDCVTGQRTLVTENAADLPDALPRISEAEIIAGLKGREAVHLLAALQAARIHPSSALIGPVLKLVENDEPSVREAAYDALNAQAGPLDPMLQIDPFEAVFSLPLGRGDKLQFLRWFLVDHPKDPSVLTPMLSRALVDQDWEIAATALMVVARLRIASLAQEVAQMSLPKGHRQGVTDEEARFLLAARDAVLMQVGAKAEKPLPVGVTEALHGDTSHLPTALAVFAGALSTPLPDDLPPPPRCAPIVQTASGPEMPNGAPLIWVPSVPHILGDASLAGQANPVRQATHPTGFYIDAQPKPPVPRDTALSLIAETERETGLTMRLPTSDEWEMAARGPDGRRFPWGLNAAQNCRMDLSPWGMAGLMRGPGEWLDNLECARAGGVRSPIPAARSSADPKELGGFRRVILVG